MNKQISIAIVVVIVIGILLAWRYGFSVQKPKLNQDMNTATTTNAIPDQLKQLELFKTSPLYKIVNSPLSEKYTNTEIGFSIMFPKKVIVKKENTYFNGDGSIFKIVIDESGYESSITDLWAFYPDNKNPARNTSAKSLDDYLQDYSAPEVKNHTVVIHKNEKISTNILRQEYSYGYWKSEANNQLQFFAGTSGCNACYFAFHYVRYVYFNPITKKIVILERSPLVGEFYENSIAFQEKELVAERIAKTFAFQ